MQSITGSVCGRVGVPGEGDVVSANWVAEQGEEAKHRGVRDGFYGHYGNYSNRHASLRASTADSIQPGRVPTGSVSTLLSPLIRTQLTLLQPADQLTPQAVQADDVHRTSRMINR